MYGISPDDNFDFLIGTWLTTASFGTSTLLLIFDDPRVNIVNDPKANSTIRISIGHDIEIITPILGSRSAENARSLANDIVTILGHTITGIKTTERTLSLIFDNEYTLVLHDDEDYDAFAIDYGDRTIVV
jgi:hypothetical protein